MTRDEFIGHIKNLPESAQVFMCNEKEEILMLSKIEHNIPTNSVLIRLETKRMES